MASVFVPVLYMLIVFGGLFVFNSLHRRRAAEKLSEPYFPSHPERNLYVTLLQRSNPPTPDPVLKSALIRRAMADVQRVIRIREDKPALQNLLQKGSIGDDLWNSLLAAEKELEAEIVEVMAEANTFVDGWGTIIFQTANEMIANEKMRSIFEHSAESRAEKELKYGKKFQPKVVLSPAPSAQPIAEPSNSSSTKLAAPSPAAANKLAPPPSAGAEDVVSSDGEGSSTPAATRTPSKSSKKNKKRK